MPFFGSSKHDGEPNFWPATSYHSGYGPLSDKDTEWICDKKHGFQTETQVWYNTLTDGSTVMVQVIWSYLSVPLLPPTAQMTFKIYNPHTKKQVWKSVNVSGFKSTGRGCKSDVFEVKHTGSAAGEEAYAISATLDKDVQINATFTKPATALGFKYGPGEDGGISTFNHKDPKKTHVFVFHRFHPMVVVSGSLFVHGEEIDMKGEGMFVHANQAGMLPNSIASRWNFAYFTTSTAEEDSTKLGKVRAIQMEFQTTDDYGTGEEGGGRVKVNVGCVYSSALPSSVLLAVGQTGAKGDVYPIPVKDVCLAEHLNAAQDADTGYMAPHGLTFEWAGERVDKQGQAKASITVDDAMSGLVAKVDVLEEIPKVLRKALAAATGTKPFIFQYHNPATLQVETEGETVPVKGWLYSEATFISA